MSLGVVIQARMGSTRLPGKVLRDIAGRPLLEHVIGRLSGLRHPAEVVIATTASSKDDVIESWCDSHSIACFRGSEIDVLDRYWKCATQFGFDHIVRLTADNPFTDIEELNRLIDLHLTGEHDYSHSFGMLPIGVGAEIFSYEALHRSHGNGLQPHHREHVNEYIPEHPELFQIGILNIDVKKRAPNLRLTVDTEEDWVRACWLAEQAQGHWLGTEEAISLCSRFV